MTPNYVLGRGRVYFDVFAPGTKTKTGERYFGNTPAMSISAESENLDHFNSDEGVRVKDDSVLLQLNRTGQVTCDNISDENVALFMLGLSGTQIQTAEVGQTSAFNDITKDRYYQLGVTTTNPSGVRNVSNVVVTKLPATVLVLGTDYTLDATLGRIFLLPTSVTLSNLDDISVAYDKAAATRSQVISAASATIDGALRYISANPKGTQRDFYMPYVRLSPNGEFQVKGDEWQQMTFSIEVQKLDDTTETLYIDGRPA